MYSEEETELRDLVMQSLDSSGFLNKIKAEVRAGVFLALEEEGNFKTKIPLFNQKYDDFINTTEGRLLVSLVREFLDFYSLKFTLAVFDPEASTPSISRSELCDQLNLKISEPDTPILSILLKDILNGKSTNNPPSGISSSDNTVKFPACEIANEKINTDELLNHDDFHQKDEKSVNQDNLENVSVENLESFSKRAVNSSAALQVEDIDSPKVSDKSFNVLKEKDELSIKNNKSNLLKDPLSDLLSSDHDPFFDAPVPSEKPSFFPLTETAAEKSDHKLIIDSQKNQDNMKISLSSLKDLPSLSANHEWTALSSKTLPSLNPLKSLSNSEAFRDENENLDSKDNFEKKDSDTEESSEKQISEEIEESMSENYDDLLNSGSFADDATTDQTVSQGSVVEGVDHVEPCNRS